VHELLSSLLLAVFINDIEDVAGRSESIVRDRRRATVAQHTEREGGEMGHCCLAHARTGLGYLF